MTDKIEKEKREDYAKLNVMPEQRYRIRLLAAKMGITIIEMIERMLVHFEREQDEKP